MTVWKIHAPASSANLGPGFDVLGLALQLHISVELEPDSDQGFAIELSGEGSDSLPTDQTNRILAVASEIAGEAVEKARWKINSEIPMARGLGSSIRSMSSPSRALIHCGSTRCSWGRSRRTNRGRPAV